MKKCLITGASGLIGSEMVRDFIAQGYQVYGFDLKNNSKLKHPDYIFIKTDISNDGSVKKSFEQIKQLDILVNNGAKTAPYNTAIEKLSLKEWQKVMDTNLTSAFLLTKYSVPLLRKSKGSIINIASTRHFMCEPHNEIYSASKGGLIALTKALAISLGGDVRVNAISPGWIADPSQHFAPQDHQQHPVKRIGRPSDISRLANYLASDAAGFITGQDFVVDGGMTVKMIYEE